MRTPFLLLLTIMSLVSTRCNAFLAARSCDGRSVYGAPRIFSAVDGKSDVPGSEVIAQRIVVVGNVHGGYYRSCVLNEHATKSFAPQASRFRSLVGTMSPPDDSEEAEIYVEGKRRMVEGFVRWCRKGDVGLSQVVSVKEVIDEEPTGLYDDFYVKKDG